MEGAAGAAGARDAGDRRYASMTASGATDTDTDRHRQTQTHTSCSCCTHTCALSQTDAVRVCAACECFVCVCVRACVRACVCVCTCARARVLCQPHCAAERSMLQKLQKHTAMAKRAKSHSHRCICFYKVCWHRTQRRSVRARGAPQRLWVPLGLTYYCSRAATPIPKETTRGVTDQYRPDPSLVQRGPG